MTMAGSPAEAMPRADRPNVRPTALSVGRRVADILLVAVIVVGLFGILLGRLLPALGHPVFVVAGPSMEPAIGVGSAIVLERVRPGQLAVGDVVSLRSGSDRAVFTHRVIRIAVQGGEVWVETKGDANAGPDPSITAASAIAGRVAIVVPGAGYLLTLLSSPAGVALVLSAGATLIVLGWLLETIESDRRRGRVRPAIPRPSLRSVRPRSLGACRPRLPTETVAVERRRRTHARAMRRGT